MRVLSWILLCCALRCHAMRFGGDPWVSLEKPGPAGLHGILERVLRRLGRQLGGLFRGPGVDREGSQYGALGPLQQKGGHDEALVLVDYLERPPRQLGAIDHQLGALDGPSNPSRRDPVAESHQAVQLGVPQGVAHAGHGSQADQLRLVGFLQKAANGLLRALVVELLDEVLYHGFGHATASRSQGSQHAAAAVSAAAQQKAGGRKIGKASRCAAAAAAFR
mmetsp:Transcript_23875/g.56252  ORF Transcript_23875/g.56252 Transcript_23875/m.56252 type:complete len:221 (+) Transcript_23875:57-719(+)